MRLLEGVQQGRGSSGHPWVPGWLGNLARPPRLVPPPPRPAQGAQPAGHTSKGRRSVELPAIYFNYV